ncbi:patatin-like phospholipase family protein [Mucilaginibacter sp.]|jgi:NTE family protein|uniref:patatin-like phospholipase family protein n=1 Tax=Mucilaginibacter sp. TaxID=1882438 RepID=UPI0035625356
MIRNKRFGVALSGGGYRAATFHLGTLKKLHELNLLGKIDVMSTISGGSITGAAYCLDGGKFEDFEVRMKSLLSTKSVIGFILKSWIFIRLALSGVIIFGFFIYLLFTNWAPLTLVILLISIYVLITYQFKIFPVSSVIEKAYDEFFYRKATLSMLRSQPEIAIGSTNLQTGRQFTFSKRKMEDSNYAYRPVPIKFIGDHFPIARAVVASSCVPFAFTPVSIAKDFFLNQEQYGTVDPQLIDGGVYDNQGVHKITQKNSSYACEIILVSDAGNNLPLQGLYNNTITLLLRTVELFMGRIKNFQMIQNIYENSTGREVAYQSLGWDLNSCVPGFVDNMISKNLLIDVVNAHHIPEVWQANPKLYRAEIETLLHNNCKIESIITGALSAENLKKIRTIGTNLIPIKVALIEDMIIHASKLTELQLRLYCPSLFI